jgi:flagellar L-ring protein precursor FlgH
MKIKSIALAAVIAAMFASGCMPAAKTVTEDLNKPTVQRALNAPTPDTTTTGSLWAGGGSGLLSDPKAARVGDLVTVLVQESASATRSLGTKKSKKSDRASGLTASIDYGSALANKSVSPKADIGMTNSKNFDGSGSTSNSDTLTASVTSVVTYVYPNGNMYIIGRRELTINQQPQEISFSGIIRPNDISPANTIPSSKVAQAKISYGSGGELASVTHEGWLSQALDQIWPF